MPEYRTIKGGPDHCPLFKAEVIVNGLSFTAPEFSKTAKDAQSKAAKLALEHFTGFLSLSTDYPITASSSGSLQAFSQAINQTTAVSRSSSSAKDDKRPREQGHLCKTQLQIYAQKRKLPLPEYVNECEGPPHARHFKSRVILEGTSYESDGYFSSLKEAENSAAKTALFSLSPDGVQEDNIYKSLLQELVQQQHCSLPEYNTIQSGASHNPIFISAVEVGGVVYRGDVAKTKKLAEQNAAKVAYSALKERGCKGSPVSNVKDAEAPGSVKVEATEAPGSAIVVATGVGYYSQNAKIDSQKLVESSIVAVKQEEHNGGLLDSSIVTVKQEECDRGSGADKAGALPVSSVSAAMLVRAPKRGNPPVVVRPTEVASTDLAAEGVTAEPAPELEGPPLTRRRLMTA